MTCLNKRAGQAFELSHNRITKKYLNECIASTAFCEADLVEYLVVYISSDITFKLNSSDDGLRNDAFTGFLAMLLHFLAVALFSNSIAQAQLMSPEQATVLAHQIFGGIIKETQVFDSDGTTYITVHRLPYEGSTENQLLLLRSFGGSFIKEADLDTVDCSGTIQEIVTSDFNNDGFINVYWHYLCGGSGLASITFKIYDSSTSQTYSSTLWTNYQPSTNLTLDPDLPSSLLPYLESKVAEHPLFDTSLDLNSEVALSWTDRYGAFSSRQSVSVTLDDIPQPLLESSSPNRCSVSAEASLGDWRYVSCFRGNVYAVNQAESVFFTVYSPQTTFDWITEMEINDGNLVIYERDDESVVLFDPTSNMLRRFE